jgi:TPR repeat protein
VAALVLTACRDRGQPDREQASTLAPADRRADERAHRMLDEAKRCERGPERAAACAAACELGHSNSCHGAGALREAAGDAAAALPLYTRACDGGSGLGCEAAGHALRAADPAAADRMDRKARFDLRVHCENRHAPSCLALGRLYTTERGGPPDAGASATFLGRACDLGLAAACPAPSRPAPF